LAELLGYNEVIFSNERSADFGNLDYLGLDVNHQWCKSSEAEALINNYIHSYITPHINTKSLLREFSEIEIVKRFVQYPHYLLSVTSCNSYFWLPPIQQRLMRSNYWCGSCPKCTFLFACFSAFLDKRVVVGMFRANLYNKKSLLPLYRRILGLEGFKPLDCVGEPGEMILAMHYAAKRGEFSNSTAMKMFMENFPPSYDFNSLEKEFIT
jgi:UDP-N-acetyl-alpha-D-muramoyl-L-alanyl-L-glutamate epimerase